MHLERVAAVALLDGLDAVAVLDAPASLHDTQRILKVSTVL